MPRVINNTDQRRFELETSSGLAIAQLHSLTLLVNLHAPLMQPFGAGGWFF
jgi:hypothetical protein